MEGENNDKVLNIKELHQAQIDGVLEYDRLTDMIQSLYKLHQSEHILHSLPNTQLITLQELLLRSIHTLSNTTYQFKAQQLLHLTKHPLHPHIIPSQPHKIKSVTGVLQHPTILHGKFSNYDTYTHYLQTCVLPEVSQVILSTSPHQEREQVISQALNVVLQFFHQTEVEIQLEKNTLVENRLYLCVYLRQLQSQQLPLLSAMSNLVNEALLCPSDMVVQGKLFTLLRRLYLYWNDCIYQPLFINIRNISLYSHPSQHHQLLKQVSMWCYRVLHDKTDIKMVELLEGCEQLQYIRQSEYFNSKTYTCSAEQGMVYSLAHDVLPFYPQCFMIRGSRQFMIIPICIHKANTLLTWCFRLENYDIRFGVFKVDRMTYRVEEYENSVKCKTVHKMEKYKCEKSHNIWKGHSFVKSGWYHAVFDNTYSLVRGKEVSGFVHSLESVM